MPHGASAWANSVGLPRPSGPNTAATAGRVVESLGVVGAFAKLAELGCLRGCFQICLLCSHLDHGIVMDHHGGLN